MSQSFLPVLFYIKKYKEFQAQVKTALTDRSLLNLLKAQGKTA